jgi:hypothetical protein
MNTVTLGGVAIGTGILVLTGIRWWFREKRQIAALTPFLLSAAYGMLAILTTGGILGGAAGIALWGANGLGDLSLVYGVGGTTSNVTRAHQVALAPGGYVIVFLLTLVIVGLWKWAGRIPTGKLFFGIIAGICLGLSGTVAGAAAVPLASGVNALGLGFTAILQ